MNLFCRLFFLVLIGGCFLLDGYSVQARKAHLPSTGAYVRLPDWCRSRGLTLRKVSGDEAYEASNSRFRFLLRVDSREARVNNIGLCLSFPILRQSSTPLVSEVDVKTALDPLLGVNGSGNAKKVLRITLDPGHGGKDPGNIVGKNKEKDYALAWAMELKRQLDKAGFKVNLTRYGDTLIPLAERPDVARRNSADLFICLHWNSLRTDRSVSGVQTFCMTPAGTSSSNGGGVIGKMPCSGNIHNRQNVQLAYEIQNSLVKNAGIEDRGVRRARYEVLRGAPMPAVLIEGGFMTNPSELKRIQDPRYRQKMAAAIVAGVKAYCSEMQ